MSRTTSGAASTALRALARIGADGIRRLTEDEAFDMAAMRDLPGVVPLGLEVGLGISLAARRHAA